MHLERNVEININIVQRSKVRIHCIDQLGSDLGWPSCVQHQCFGAVRWRKFWSVFFHISL